LTSTNVPPSDVESAQIRQLIQHKDEHISQLNAEIQRNSTALATLIERRDAHQQDAATMRAILSPMRRFPPEILSEIFLLALAVAQESHSYSSIDRAQPPNSFARVCSSWRATSITTPRLWSKIRLVPTGQLHCGSVSLLTLFLERSRPHPVRFALTAPRKAEIVASLAIIWSFCNRLECLTLDVCNFHLQPLVGILGTMFPCLQSLDVSIRPSRSYGSPDPPLVGTVDGFKHAPCLKNLKLVAPGCLVRDVFGSQFPWAQLTNLHMSFRHGLFEARAILSKCSELESCFLNIHFPRHDEQIAVPPCVLPKLQTINFTVGPDIHLVSEFFRPFSFPQLRILTINASTWSEDILPQLHERSGFELQQLHLSSLSIQGTQLATFLHRILSLKRLSIHNSRAGDDGLLFALLHSRLPHTVILPNLEHLVLDTAEDLAGNVLADMLESRWEPDAGPVASAP
ncbi:hypothetical protein FB451DRAFT_953723, partial [Mycena latifolia]